MFLIVGNSYNLLRETPWCQPTPNSACGLDLLLPATLRNTHSLFNMSKGKIGTNERDWWDWQIGFFRLYGLFQFYQSYDLLICTAYLNLSKVCVYLKYVSCLSNFMFYLERAEMCGHTPSTHARVLHKIPRKVGPKSQNVILYFYNLCGHNSQLKWLCGD